MLRISRIVFPLASALLLAGCAGAPKQVNPQFGLQTLALVGALKFEHGTNSIITDVLIRFEDPGRFELIATKGPNMTFCHILADKEDWRIEFPMEKRTLTGHGTPGNEQLALWVETHRMVVMAVKKAQFQEDFTETVRGEYKSGRWFTIEFSEFRRLVGQIFATRMKLTCRGCQSSIEIALRDVR